MSFAGNCYRRNLYTLIGGQLFRWSIDSISGDCALWFVEEPGIPGKAPNQKLKLLLSFTKDVPVITPTNINEKLSAYILFL